jgi:hypothetical protein
MIGSAIGKRPTKKVYGQINLIWRAGPGAFYPIAARGLAAAGEKCRNARPENSIRDMSV